MQFKDIQISLIRNLENSFEEAKESGDNFDDLDNEYECGGDALEEDILGMNIEMAIMDKRSLGQSSMIVSKIKIGEKQWKGPKFTRMQLEIVGSAKGQNKLRSRKGLAFSQEQ